MRTSSSVFFDSIVNPVLPVNVQWVIMSAMVASFDHNSAPMEASHGAPMEASCG